MGQYLGYPDEMLDPGKINEMYQGLLVKEDDHLENVLRLSRHFHAYNAKKLREVADPRDWHDHYLVAVVNAFYNPDLNHFEFPAGILQGNFFNPRLPRYMNFGAIGHIIGHEITHGFDDRGRHRNSQGIKVIDIFLIASLFSNFSKKEFYKVGGLQQLAKNSDKIHNA